MRPWILEEVNYGHVKANPYHVAVLPMGATEPHNLHLPYGTDTYQVNAIARRACAEATAKGAKVVMLPAIPYGTETNMMTFPLAMNVLPSTLLAVFRDLIDSLGRHNVRRLVILNGHGGNDFKPFLRELYGRAGVHLFLCDWFRGLSADAHAEIFETRDDHAGEVETSLMLHIAPNLVARDTETGALKADAGATRSTRLPSINKGWLSITRPWHLLTTNSGSGNPMKATAEKGKAMMDLLVSRLTESLVELSAAELDEKFPY